MRRVAAIILTVVLTACSNALRWTPDYHTVQTGETLYAIAMRYDIDHRRLAAWNGLGDGTFIRKGQRIYLKGPAPGGGRTAAAPPAAPLLPAPAWQWPTAGAVAETYGATPQSQSGIRIAGREGQPVYAVAGGEVVYAGGGLPTYGQLVIIKHNETWLSAYG